MADYEVTVTAQGVCNECGGMFKVKPNVEDRRPFGFTLYPDHPDCPYCKKALAQATGATHDR